MKKLIIALASVLLICSCLSGCEKSKPIEPKQPDIVQIRSICELATIECYYHNVAKSVKNKTNIMQKDRKFWIEYTGAAKIGIDMSKVNMEISEHNITVTLPKAKLLNLDIYENDLTEKSFISEEDKGILPNKITAEDQTSAINSAQKNMEQTIQGNNSLFVNAQDRAKKLIGNYIEKLGEISGIKYQIKWVYSDTETTPTSEKNN